MANLECLLSASAVSPRLTIPECCRAVVHFRALSSAVVSIEDCFLVRTPSKQVSSSSVPL
jgi:hypothetical protein